LLSVVAAGQYYVLVLVDEMDAFSTPIGFPLLPFEAL